MSVFVAALKMRVRSCTERVRSRLVALACSACSSAAAGEPHSRARALAEGFGRSDGLTSARLYLPRQDTAVWAVLHGRWRV